MVRFLKALFFILIAAVVVFLSIANRESVTVSLDPFSRMAPEFSFTAPLFLVLFGAVACGVLIGGGAAWIAQRGKRRELRQTRREAKALRVETDRLRAENASRYPALPRSGTSS